MLPIRETRKLSRRMKRTLAGLLPFGLFWKIFYRIGGEASPFNPLPITNDIPTGAIDLVITTGPRTSAANIAVARLLKAKNVYFGFSKWPSDGFYTVLLTAERRRPHPHRAYTLRPSELDAAELPEARPLAPNGAALRASLLFGGQSKHYYYTMADMELLAERLIALRRAMPWLDWTVFDSRRSPKEEFDRLVSLVEASGAEVEFVRFAEHGLLVEQSGLRLRPRPRYGRFHVDARRKYRIAAPDRHPLRRPLQATATRCDRAHGDDCRQASIPDHVFRP